MKTIKVAIVLIVALESAIWFFSRTHPPKRNNSVKPRVENPQKAVRSRVNKVEASVVSTSHQVHSSEPSRQSVREFREALIEIKNCYDLDCDFPKDDARSYSFAVGRKLKETLTEMTAWVLSEKLEDREVDEIAREYVASEDGHVQEAALRLMSTQPPSLENLLAILQNIIQIGYDSRLIPPTLKELQRYTDRQDRERIHQALGEAMLTGAPFVAAEVSVGIAPFINDWSISFFRDLAQQLPEDSVYRRNLEAALAAAN